MPKRIAMLLLITCLITLGCKEVKCDPNVTTAVAVEMDGCPNLHKVSDTLYRSAQPSKEGFKNLEKAGIKTIVNLRTSHSDEKLIEGTSLEQIRIKSSALKLSEDQITAFLKLATDSEKAPILLHCRHGADRTGAMIAAYRIVVEGWEKEKAIKEMTEGPFNFHAIFRNLPKLIKELDTEKIKDQLNNTSDLLPTNN